MTTQEDPRPELPPTREQLIAKFIQLHAMLGDFQMMMARKTYPYDFKDPDSIAITKVLEIIERETPKRI